MQRYIIRYFTSPARFLKDSSKIDFRASVRNIFKNLRLGRDDHHDFKSNSYIISKVQADQYVFMSAQPLHRTEIRVTHAVPATLNYPQHAV